MAKKNPNTNVIKAEKRLAVLETLNSKVGKLCGQVRQHLVEARKVSSNGHAAANGAARSKPAANGRKSGRPKGKLAVAGAGKKRGRPRKAQAAQA